MESGQYGEGGQSAATNTNVSDGDDENVGLSVAFHPGALINKQTGSGELNKSVNLNNELIGNIGESLLTLLGKKNVNELPTAPLSQGTEVITDKSTARKINLDRRYTTRDIGPFYVFIEHKELNTGKLHPMKVGRLLNNLPKNIQDEIIEVTTVGRNRVKISVKSGEIANLLVSHDVFTREHMFAYIPQHLTEKKAIIRGVDTAITEQDLRLSIRSVIPVLDVKRLTRVATDRDSGKVIMGADGKAKRVPRQMVLVTFQGLTLPEYVYIDRVRCEVERYVPPVIQCFRCFRYGHTKDQCRGSKLCKKCGQGHDEDVCQEISEYCIYCQNTDHSSTSKRCPQHEKQKKIKVTMADYNLTFKEAEKVVNFPSFSNAVRKNRFSVLQNLDSDFPSLPSQRSTRPNTRPYLSQPRSAPSNSPTAPPQKRRKPTTPEAIPPLTAPSNFRFCGPPIKNNPFTGCRTDLTAKLTNSLVTFIDKLVTDVSEKREQVAKQSIESQISQIVCGILDNKLDQTLTYNVSSPMEC